MRVWQGPAHLSGGPSSTINISVVVYFAYDSTANFLFRGPIVLLNISKESPGYGNRSSPRILEIGPVILKLTRFPRYKVNATNFTKRFRKWLHKRGRLRIF